MLSSISLFPILGMPMFLYFGALALILMLITATAGFLTFKGKIKLKWHMRLAVLTVVSALIHGIMALSLILKF